MGGHLTTVKSLQVYKIDVPRCLIYVKGGVPGRVGQVLRIKDATKKHFNNEEYLNFPTFLEEDGKIYADEIIMKAPAEDPEEKNFHDNDVVD